MGLIDDLATRVQQINTQVDKAKKDVNTYINSNITDPLVKVGLAATGNLSEAEIKAGKKASPPPILPVAPIAQAGLGIGAIAVIGIAAYFLFFAKKSRG